jgi:uncharacterized protein YjbI with pentapeptide repeats
VGARAANFGWPLAQDQGAIRTKGYGGTVANEEHLRILRQGVQTWKQWREEHPEIRPGLSRADLAWANLRGADLSDASLFEADH